jgi:hypothetical protein
MTPEEVHTFLDQGADPNWVAPNGLSVLEHALIRYWNGDAVDVLAARTTPRRALWIAAGLGDVDGVRGFLDRRHMPTAAAHRMRPDFVAAGMQGAMTPMPYADDEEVLLEVLLVAVLNGRTKVLDYLASRGAPLNSLLYGAPLIHIAVGNAMVDVAECLVRGGADLDLGGPGSRTSAREMAREWFELFPADAARRRVVELCGLDPDVILAERDARPVPTAVIDSTVGQALELARRDAAYLGQPDVRPENLLVGLIRAKGPPLYFLKDIGRMQVNRFRADKAGRFPVLDDGAGAEHERELPMHADADAVLEIAISVATERRSETVDGLHLLLALTARHRGPVADLLTRYGASASTIRAELERGLQGSPS